MTGQYLMIDERDTKRKFGKRECFATLARARVSRESIDSSKMHPNKSLTMDLSIE